MKFKSIILTIASLALIGCSQYERTVDDPMSSEELDYILNDILPEVQSLDNTLEYLAYGEDSYSTVYVGKGTVDFDGVLNEQQFVESFDGESSSQSSSQPAQNYMGYPENTFSFYNFDFIFPDMYAEDMYDSTVLFFADEETGEYALVVKVWFTTEAEDALTGIPYIVKYYSQSDDAVITTDAVTKTKKLELTFQDTETGEYIYLQTFDVANNDRLKPVIQLEVYTEDAGELYYNGKFSTLVGYQ